MGMAQENILLEKRKDNRRMLDVPIHLIESARRIPCTDAMIRAIDDDRKTETRRPVKFLANGSPAKCLYGEPGDLLLVTGSHILVDASGQVAKTKEARRRAIYRADWKGEPAVEDDDWRPPMFMPKWSPTRLLRNTGREIVRLCDITEEQAIAEGIRQVERKGGTFYIWNDSQAPFLRAVDAFEDLWNNIHKERGLLFGHNPMVWRIQFEKLAPSEL
jgi:hypothetical protein